MTNRRFSLSLPAALAAAALAAACQTVDYDPSTGTTRRSSRVDDLYSSPAPVNEGARNATRLDTLEMQVQQLSLKVDEFSQNQGFASQNADSARRDSASLRSEIDALKADLAATKAQLAQTQADQDRTAKAVDALPSKIKSIVGSSPTPVPPSSRSSVSRSPAQPSGDFYEYTVQSGQTVSDIAHAYGVSAADVIRANNLNQSGMIRVGQKLLIPKK